MARTQPFDEYYEEYENWFEDNYYAYQSELRALGYLTPQKGKGMEIGIGSGRFAVPLEIGLGVESKRFSASFQRSRASRTSRLVTEKEDS